MSCYFGAFNQNKVHKKKSHKPTIHECTAWKIITGPASQYTKSFSKSVHAEARDISIGCTNIEHVDVGDISMGWTQVKPYAKFTRSVTWSENIHVREIPMRDTHVKPQRQGTRSVTWNENVQVFHIPRRTTHVESQEGRQHTRSVTWDTYTKNFFMQEEIRDFPKKLSAEITVIVMSLNKMLRISP